ncbi:PREDICTED: non-specific lipid-transfer protein-like protein At2g13820 [Nicotiana attenuata]|uniref:Non-specific lipid-transfer protein-like protein n=1 Tax=Nicotiana attenuata TaxID=49451 RepID=A0A314LE37_NICAT|nr:PREDICTED: non-specific lipid-transfer protein-like protein At2g13820 [Nicotiana attenuata]OIT39823.1 non-specific lipid-transfer protein-like protein [Nicotiana attenuata]
MNTFPIVTCILATWVVVAVNAGHGSAPPIQSPIKAPSPSPSSPSPVPTADCSTIVMDMMPCLKFLEADSNGTKPDDSCCSGFKQVLKTNPDCICVALATSASFGITVNMTQAAVLPSDCGVSAPPLTNCNSTTAPSASPVNPSSPVNPPAPINPPSPLINPPAPVVNPPAPVVNPPTPQPAAAPTSKSPAPAPADADQAPVQAPNAESSGSTINLTSASFSMLFVMAAFASLA